MVFTSYSLTYRLIGKKDPVAPQDEKKYIVFFSCLMELFAVCPNCTEPATAEVTKVIGTQIYVTQKCPACKFVRQWKSQPNIRRIPAGKSFTFSCHSLFGQCDITDPANIQDP